MLLTRSYVTLEVPDATEGMSRTGSLKEGIVRLF
jgi:hypothetical protein